MKPGKKKTSSIVRLKGKTVKLSVDKNNMLEIYFQDESDRRLWSWQATI